jgi:hypothetical protein
MLNLKGMIVGSLALAGVTVGAADVQAMPIQPLTSTLSASNGLESVWWRGGYGWRGYGFGPRFYGPGWRRPFVGAYGWRRPFYGYGWRRPFYGRGWRRW